MDRKAAKKTPVEAPAPDWGWPGLAVRLAAGGLLVFAGALKASAPAEEFAVVIEGYNLLPPDAAGTLAVFLPWVELLVGWSLVWGFRARAAAAAAAALYAAFALAVASALARGIYLPDCGCFGMGFHPPPAATLALDLLLLGGLILTLKKGGSSLSLDKWAEGGYT